MSNSLSHTPLERPQRLPKIYRPNNGQAPRDLPSLPSLQRGGSTNGVRRSGRRVIRPTKVVPSTDRSDCDQYLAEHANAAAQGDYDDRCEFLNRLHQLIQMTFPDSLNDQRFFEDICELLLIFLKDDHPAIRAMCFRLFRLCTFTERNLVVILTKHVDIYMVRALDLRVENDMERSESMQLIAAMITIYQKSNLKKLIMSSAAQKNGKKYAFPKSIMQPVIAIALNAINTPRMKDPSETSTNEPADKQEDRLAVSCVALFLEFCVLEPALILDMAGTDWMVRILTGISAVSRRVAAVVGKLLVTWLDDPQLRVKANLHLVLEQIFAPLIEFGFFQKNAATELGEKVVESVMENFNHSFLCILRSWSGLFACAAVGPNSTVIASSPLRLLEYLGLGTVGTVNLSRIRDMIVDICCDFMDLPYANMKFETWAEAQLFYENMAVPDGYKSSLKDDFVLTQSDLLLANTPEFVNHVDLLSSFRALAFFVLINAGLPQSLARLVVAQPESPSALKATLLMADMLRSAPLIVPNAWRAAVLSLPTLVQSACESITQCKASAAINDYYDADYIEQYTFVNAENAQLVLHRFDQLNRIWIHNQATKPAADSNYALFVHQKVPESSILFSSLSESSVQSLLNDSVSGEGVEWLAASCLFSTLTSHLKVLPTKAHILDEIENMINKVMWQVSPSCGPQMGWKKEPLPIVVAKEAIIVALHLVQVRPQLAELLTKYAEEFRVALQDNDTQKGLFIVKNLSVCGSMYHFALIGTLSGHPAGQAILEKTQIMQAFIDMMSLETPIEYVKLIVSCLHYDNNNELARIVLQKALTCTNEPARRWCTRFLCVLASLGLDKFEEWGIKLMLAQMGDTSVKVIRHAIRNLHAWLPTYPNAVKQLRLVHLDSFGDAGILLKAHLYSDRDVCVSPIGMQEARAAVKFWMDKFNIRYMQSIDDDMRVALLSVRRSLDGGFSRSSGERLDRFGLRAPVHLFGALASHDVGRGILEDMYVCDTLTGQLSDDTDPLIVKGALMALGNIAGAVGGLKILPNDTIPRIVRHAEESPVLSIRGVAFWALNVVGCTEDGARALAAVGWESNRYRHVVDETRLQSELLEAAELRRPTLTPTLDGGSEWRSHMKTRPPSLAFLDLPSSPSHSTKSPISPARKRSATDAACGGEKIGVRNRLTRSSSDVGIYTVHEDGKEINDNESQTSSASRVERTMTAESGVTSGLGSMMEESIISRRRGTTMSSMADEWDARSRTHTIAHCLTQGLVASRSQLEIQGAIVDMIRDPHFSWRQRERWRLAPLKMKRYMQVNRNVGDPVRYVYMTKDEESSLSDYRKVMLSDDWLWQELSKNNVNESSRRSLSTNAVHTVVLPTEVEIICGNIFPSRLRSDLLQNDRRMEDRGAKSGHGRSQRTDARLAHSAYRCFYCSLELKVDEFVVPANEDVAFLRREVLNQVDMLEIKQALPEKKLISLRRDHPWLFEWPCLYADVLELLDEYRFKTRSRAFLQEIFYGALRL